VHTTTPKNIDTDTATVLEISISDIFDPAPNSRPKEITKASGFFRNHIAHASGLQVISDTFTDIGAKCCFLRIQKNTRKQIRLSISGSYQFTTSPVGGWILEPTVQSADDNMYWIPQSPTLRNLDNDGHILSIQAAGLGGAYLSTFSMSADIQVPVGNNLDLVVWKFKLKQYQVIDDLKTPLFTIESQKMFLWSSHTTYHQPSDVYLHLIYGHVYENHEVWPKYWRVCSELDAYALYITLKGLEKSTGKRLYSLLKAQIVYSVISRQAEDGGWYHGEWTDTMESHYRLHTAGILLLSAFYEETGDETVLKSLRKAVQFAAGNVDKLDHGMWFYHDSLEQSPEMEKLYPFRPAKSQGLGKSSNNLLVLNTHLDTTIALHRYQQVSGDNQYTDLVDSAKRSAHSVLELRSAEFFYRLIYKTIYLSFLPTRRAVTLPAHLRALKRLGWKYLVPRLKYIKARFPRLVMPGGFIERDLVQKGGSVRYQPVNLMDLIRWQNIFNESFAATKSGLEFTVNSGIIDRWKEKRGKEDDSLGFWSEALYHLCLTHPGRKYRAWLAEAILNLEDNGLGISPSLLGSNPEAIPLAEQHPCPSPGQRYLRVVNFSHGTHIELLVINPTSGSVMLEWETAPPESIVWENGKDITACSAAENDNITVPPRGWLWGRSNNGS